MRVSELWKGHWELLPLLSGFKELRKCEMCLRPNVQETEEEAKVGPQRPGDHYVSGAGNAKAIPFGQKKFGVHMRKPSPTLCVFLRHTQLGLSRSNENHVFLGSG